MTTEGLKPVRIRNAIRRKFNLSPEALLALSQIQRFCQYYASTKLGSNDYLEETRQLIRDAGYYSTTNEHKSFTLSLAPDSNRFLRWAMAPTQNLLLLGPTSGPGARVSSAPRRCHR